MAIEKDIVEDLQEFKLVDVLATHSDDEIAAVVEDLMQRAADEIEQLRLVIEEFEDLAAIVEEAAAEADDD